MNKGIKNAEPYGSLLDFYKEQRYGCLKKHLGCDANFTICEFAISKGI